MNFEDFERLEEKMWKEERAISLNKGIEYSNCGSKLSLFDELGQQTRCPHCKKEVGPKIILWVLLSKHLRSIINYINTGKEYEEGIEDRIKDSRVYLSLLRAIVERERSN